MDFLISTVFNPLKLMLDLAEKETRSRQRETWVRSAKEITDSLEKEFVKLKQENEALKAQLKAKTEAAPETPSLSTSPLSLPKLGPTSYGEGEPPVKGAIPAVTARGEDGKIYIGLCRQYAGEGWVYTPVADGWITVTREDE